MQIELLKSKIHRVKITEANLHYIGSITIDEDLMDAANIIENEKVQVLDIDNGERLETYVIKGTRGSGMICMNGPAARRINVADTVIIISYAIMDFEEAKIIWPKRIAFKQTYNKEPNIQSNDPQERRMAECILYLKEEKRKRANG